MREQLLDDLDLFEYTESFNEFDVDLNQTLDDVELESLDAELEEIDEQEKVNKCDDPDFAYLPCAAHNIQLVVKDGLKLDKTYTLLIKKITWIVAKAKTCSSISEELRNLNKYVNKCVVTRWNSILFMIRSVLRITPQEWADVRSKMKRITFSQEQKYKKFFISDKDRSMLSELQSLLTMFELVTDEFQSNRISISRVYPCVDSLREKLKNNLLNSVYTTCLTEDLLESLDKRFGGKTIKLCFILFLIIIKTCSNFFTFSQE